MFCSSFHRFSNTHPSIHPLYYFSTVVNPDDKSDVPNCQTDAGVICYQFLEAIGCCPDCKQEYDEFADCMLGTGRVIDRTECDSLCNPDKSGVGTVRARNGLVRMMMMVAVVSSAVVLATTIY